MVLLHAGAACFLQKILICIKAFASCVRHAAYKQGLQERDSSNWRIQQKGEA